MFILIQDIAPHNVDFCLRTRTLINDWFYSVANVAARLLPSGQPQGREDSRDTAYTRALKTICAAACAPGGGKDSRKGCSEGC